MTRVLSELLGVRPLEFRSGIEQLEKVSGHDNTDIRLSTELSRAMHSKLKQLGLDPHDTTGPELYHALQTRVAADDARLTALLRQKHGHTPSGEDTTHIVKELSDLPLPKSCFSLKTAVAKRLLKKYPPKHAMKLLGYRSLESLLKRESAAHIYAAGWLAESMTWRKQMLDSYKGLKVTDFELRPMTITSPSTARWRALANSHMLTHKHNVLTFRELGAIVVLPLPAETMPKGAVLVSLLLALHEMNEVHAASTFLKLCQVKPNFGELVQQVAHNELSLPAQLFGRAVPWQIIQRYYARFADRFRAELFEPHVQAEDLSWHSIEKVLAYIDPELAFWQHTTHLSLLHEHQPVSCNIIDAALNYCNQLDYKDRIVHYFRHSLWHELLIRYLKHDNVEQLVLDGLESELVTLPEIT
jgi:hypothetical protein